MLKHLKSYVKNIKESGEIHAIASTSMEDRDGDMIMNEAWDYNNYVKNPLLLWSHDVHSLPIGKIVNINNKNGMLEFDAIFAEKENPFAEQVSKLMKGGFLNAFSVGYIPKSFDDKGRTTEAELLEISVVNVPANQQALVSREYKSFCNELKTYIKVKKGDKCTMDNGKEGIMEMGDNGEMVCIPKEQKEIKSPACRMDGESEQDCVSRKIPEIKKENPDMDDKQVQAIAFSTCRKKCSEKNYIDDTKKLIEHIKKVETATAYIKYTLNKNEKVVARQAKKRNKHLILKALRVVDKAVEQAIVLSKKKGGVI
jgi:HK97 family phage prohead protease